ncbi:MAG: hypothetical protein Q8Q98_12385 [Polaromonas sp.]|nr:hypothetical protein [Polaromonas sp.]
MPTSHIRKPMGAIVEWAKRRLVAPVLLTATLVVAPLLAFSESTVRSIVDRWLSQCIVVVDSSQRSTEAPIIRIHTFGEMPASLPLTFATDEGQIDQISLINHVEQETTRIEANLLVHPLANQRCPGDLCPAQTIGAEKLTIRLKPVSPNYLYQLRILTTPAVSEDRIKVYVRPLQGEAMPCRVERATLANYVARQSKLVQLVLLSVGVVLLALVMGYLRRPKGDFL